MTEAEIESLAKRYIGYLGVESRIDCVARPFNVSIGGFVFMSYTGFLFGGSAIPGADGFCEKSYNDLIAECFNPDIRTLEYSTAEELDFKLSAMGF